MLEVFNWAIVAPGRIANRFAEAVQGTAGAQLLRVHARDSSKAHAFAADWQREGRASIEASSDLQALLDDPRVHAVYIASPHNAHFEISLACLQAGKPVLCEKPLCMNVAQTEALVRAARERGVFLMEALWTRYLPAYERIGQWLREGRIGRLRAVQSSFCFNVPYTEESAQSRIYNPALAGGCVLDIGVYNLAMTRWAFEVEVRRLQPSHPDPLEPVLTHVMGSLAPNGVEKHAQAQLRLQQADIDIQAQFVCAFDCDAENRMRLYGELGYIETGSKFGQATSATLHLKGQDPEVADCPFAINGFEYQLQEAMQCIQSGQIESPRMPHAESIALAGQMAEMRQRAGSAAY